MSRRQGRYERRREKRLESRRRRSEETGGLAGAYQFHKVYRHGKACCAGTRWKRSVQLHEMHLFSGTARTIRKVLDGTNRWKRYTHFTVSERGKTRPIDAPHVSDRHTQKVLTKEILLPLLEPSMIWNNGASLPGKGLAHARRLLKQDLRRHYRKYGMNGKIIVTDCEKFFPTAPHESIRAQHTRYIFDAGAKKMTDGILETIPSGVGVPLGVEPSQIEMVALPSPADNYMKCQVGLHGFGHYMDDYIMLVPPERDAEEILRIFTERMGKIGIRISKRKTRIVDFGKAFRFCKAKYTVEKNGRIVTHGSRETGIRARRKLKALKPMYDAGKLSAEDLWASVQGAYNYYREHDDHGRILKLKRTFYAVYGYRAESIKTVRARTA